jgi:MFS transporter, DHA3 family, macrolide efflux protein
MSLIAMAQVFGLMLSGYLAQRLGIRPLFIACAAVLALISAAGYLMMRGRPAGATSSAAANPQSAAASPKS